MGGKADLLLLASLIWQQLAPSVAQITGCTAQPVTLSCVTGDTPQKYKLTCTNYPTGFTTGSTITWTFDKAIFGSSQTPTGQACNLIDNTAGSNTATFTCTTSADGLSVAFQHTGGGNANGPSLTFEVGEPSGFGLVALPAAGDVALSSVAHSGGTTFTGPDVQFMIINPPLVELTTGNMLVGTQPGMLKITFVFPISTTHVYFAANKDVFIQDTNPGTHEGIVIVPATAMQFVQATVNRVHVEFNAPVSRGTQLEFQIRAPAPGVGGLLAVMPNDPGTVTISIFGDVQVASDGTEFVNSASGYGTILSAGSIIGDPVTWIGGNRVEFKLPEGKLTTMLAMPDLVVSASPFYGISGEQWIGRIVVTSAKTQAMVVQIDVEQDLTNFTRTALAPNDFETMTVLTPQDSVRGQPPHDSQITHPEGFVMLMGKMPCKYEQHVPCREGLLVFSQFATLFIASSSASEYYGEHTVDALRHGHLDFDVFDMKETGPWTGVLPELWGFIKRSPETEAMLTPEALQLLVDGNARSNSSMTAASVKSVEPKGICIGCSDPQDRLSLMVGMGGHTAEL